MIVHADGGYSYAGDFDDETYVLLAANNAGGDKVRNHNEEHIGAEEARCYESLVVQRVLSAQMERAEQNQRHTVFQIKCVINERSCRVIINGGSCNNLARAEMVEKHILSTSPHPQPYYIQWLNSSGEVKVTQLALQENGKDSSAQLNSSGPDEFNALYSSVPSNTWSPTNIN
jgi:hypothetical protein